MIYLLDELMGNQEEDYTIFIEFLSDDRREKMHRYHQVKDKALCVYSYCLLDFGLYKEYGKRLQDEIISISERGKPYFSTSKDIYFNLSHCDSAAACGISNNYIGVDIQNYVKDYEDIQQMVCNPYEIDALNVAIDSNKLFIKYWTLKESLVKYTGEGISDKLKEYNFSNLPDMFYKYDCFFTSIYRNDYCLSVCSDKSTELNEFVILSKQDLKQFYNIL